MNKEHDYSSEELHSFVGAGQVRVWIQHLGEPFQKGERNNYRFFVAEEIRRDFYSFFRIIGANGVSQVLTESFISENSIEEDEGVNDFRYQ